MVWSGDLDYDRIFGVQPGHWWRFPRPQDLRALRVRLRGVAQFRGFAVRTMTDTNGDLLMCVAGRVPKPDRRKGG